MILSLFLNDFAPVHETFFTHRRKSRLHAAHIVEPSSLVLCREREFVYKIHNGFKTSHGR